MRSDWRERFGDSYPLGLEAADLTAALTAVAESPEVNGGSVIMVEVMDSSHVAVRTGVIYNRRAGSGQMVLVARDDDGSWAVVESFGWIA